MRKRLILLVAVILLYMIPSAVLQAIYGPSFGFLSGEDCWMPDGSGGWVKHGAPLSPMPGQPSVDVPISVRYIPILLPGALLVLFLFTPLSKKLESKAPPATDQLGDSASPPGERDHDTESTPDTQKPPG
jgi:hypothetical protein